jgi:hypothetical protein
VIWPPNHSDGFHRFGLKTGGDSFWWFGLKTCCDGFWRFGLKTYYDGFPVWPQNRWLWFGDLGLKITATVSLFGPQNQVGDGLSVAPQNRREYDGVGHTSRSSNLLHVEASRARVFQSGLRTNCQRRDDGWCTWHYRGGCVRGKLKTDGSMQWVALDPATLPLPFSMY